MSAPPRPIIEADLHAFVDGQMDFERRALFVQAMDADPELSRRVEQWRRQNAALTSTFGGILREPVPLRLMPTTLSRGKSSSAPTTELDRPSASAMPASSSLPLRTAAIAIAAFIAGGALVFIAETLWVGPGSNILPRTAELMSPAGTRGVALRAYEAHRTYATDLTHPVEVPASDMPRLLKWIQHRLSMAIRIPDLQHEGWTLIGGRILPGELGPAAFLIYADGVERLGVYLARTNAHETDSLSIFDNGTGLGSVAYWTDEPVGYALTTNRDAAWLERNGEALYRTIKAQAQDNASSE